MPRTQKNESSRVAKYILSNFACPEILNCWSTANLSKLIFYNKSKLHNGLFDQCRPSLPYTASLALVSFVFIVKSISVGGQYGWCWWLSIYLDELAELTIYSRCRWNLKCMQTWSIILNCFANLRATFNNSEWSCILLKKLLLLRIIERLIYGSHWNRFIELLRK